MGQMNEQEKVIAKYKEDPPKIIGGYKRQGWAIKVLDKIENEAIEAEEDGSITAKAVLESNDKCYYPAFLNLDLEHKGQIIGAYFIAEDKDQFDLIPFEIAKEFIEKEEKDLIPFKYRTLEKIDGDEFQINWPEFS